MIVFKTSTDKIIEKNNVLENLLKLKPHDSIKINGALCVVSEGLIKLNENVYNIVIDSGRRFFRIWFNFNENDDVVIEKQNV
jgi:hypothetical protein